MANPLTASSFALEEALAHARAAHEQDLADLVEELRIPSISTLPDHRDECRRAAGWLVDRFEAMGFTVDLVDVIEDGNPVLRAEWMGRPGAPTLTIYGHYDVQPPDPLDEWSSPPFEPRLDGGFLYARGVADNKGNHLAAVKAAEHWMAVGGPPCNVRFLIEGEEEVGGESLPIYLRDHGRDLGTDLVILWDGGFTADDRPSCIIALRGLLFVELEVAGVARDLHSGGFGGVTPNACAALARIVGRLHDAEGRIAVPGFYDGVVTPSQDELARWHVAPDLEERLAALAGIPSLVGEPEYSVAERLWARPTLEVNGMAGGFTGDGVKTIVPAKATAKLSVRLVHGQDPDDLVDKIRDFAAENAGAHVRTEVRVLSKSPAIYLGHDHRGVRAVLASMSEAFGRDAVIVRSGGSIPVAEAFSDSVGAPMVISGIGHVAAGIHGPNERLAVDSYIGGIEAIMRVMERLATAGETATDA